MPDEKSNGYWVRYEDHHGHLIRREFVSDNSMKVVIQSAFAKANTNIFEGDVCTIRSEGVFIPSPTDPKKKVYNFEIELLNGEKKTATFNNTSLRAFTLAWGDESSNWVGKQITASIVKVQAFGKVVDSIIWTPTLIQKEEEVKE